MKVDYNGSEILVDSETAMILRYKDFSMLNCLYVDISEQNSYMVMSENAGEYPIISSLAIAEGVPIYDGIIDVDFDVEPHLYVMNSMGRILAKEAEELANGEI